MTEKIQGNVKWFRSDKGFGFIQSNEEEYFVHYSNIQGDGYKSLMKNDLVLFVPIKGEKGLQATDVQVII